MGFPTLPNIIMGLLGVGIGIYFIVKAYYLNHHIYFLSWFERKWGGGGGTLAYRWIGVGMIIFSIMVLTGNIDLAGTNGFEREAGQTQTTGGQTPQPTGGPVLIAP